MGDILTWSQANSGQTSASEYTFGYDAADQLKSATLTSGTAVQNLAYGYDAAGNRTTTQTGSVVTSGSANAVNQVLQISGGGPMRFAGTVSKPSTLTVGGNPATLTPQATTSGTTYGFEGYAVVSSASTTTVEIVATDNASPQHHTTTKHVDVPPSSVPATAYLYDNNGNMTAAGPAGTPDVTYGWDAANRLTSIVKSGTTTQFEYDGLGRRVREKINNTETKRWVWDGLELCEERDTNNAVTKRYYAQGMQVVSGSNSGSYYYTRDHLGSVRELTDGTGAIRARYDYDPYGQRSANMVTGTNAISADFSFTGHYQHASGLTLAPYRAYDPTLGRWLSRDPLDNAEMLQGPNLYAYVGNNPVYWVDPLGLWGAGFAAGATGAAGPGPVSFGAATASGGAGYFSGSGLGAFGSAGAFGGGALGQSAVSWPANNSPAFSPTGNYAAGTFAGAGVGGFLTNANTPCDLKKTTNTLSVDVGSGPFSFSFQLSYGNGIWAASLTFGPGDGIAISQMSTSTIATH